jgi:AcrR family transcriptional regulator
MRRVDREAMARAIEMLRQDGGAVARLIDDKLAREPWDEVGRFASYVRQDGSLNLKPWQWPPCWLRTDDDVEAALAEPENHTGRKAAAELVQRLLAAGLSRFEPDPIAALERAERMRDAAP